MLYKKLANIIIPALFAITDTLVILYFKDQIALELLNTKCDVSTLSSLVIQKWSHIEWGIAISSFLIRFFVSQNDCCRTNKKDVVLAILFSLVMVFGNSYELTDSSALVAGNSLLLVLSIVIYILTFSCALNLVILTKKIIYVISNWNPNLPKIWKEHSFIFPLIVILLCWIPYLIVGYPARFEYDAYHQLMSYLGDFRLTQHWPVTSTYFFGFTYDVGRMIFHSNNAAIFFVTVVQTVICAISLAFTINVQKNINVSSGWRLISLVIYSIMPIFPRYLTALVKDALFSCSVVVFIAILALILFGKRENRVVLCALLLEGVGVCLLRNNGKYIILFCLLFTIMRWLKSKHKIMLRLSTAMISVLLIQLLYSSLLVNIGIPKGSEKEALSIPFQQTARYVFLYDEQVTDTEKEAIGLVLEYDTIVEKYNPKLSDPVKGTYHAEKSGDLINYFVKAWLPGLFRHPMSYIAATFNNIEGFFYPFSVEKSSGIYTAVNFDSEVKYFNGPGDYISLKTAFIESIKKIENAFFLFCNCGMQMWLSIGLIIYTLAKGYKKQLLMIPTLIGLLVIIASPTFVHNGLRYALPVLFGNIFLCSVLLLPDDVQDLNNHNENKDNLSLYLYRTHRRITEGRRL